MAGWRVLIPVSLAVDWLVPKGRWDEAEERAHDGGNESCLKPTGTEFQEVR